MIVGIILAAGESKRMGRPKQLLSWGETTVLQRVLDVVVASPLDQVILVLGAWAEEIDSCLALPGKVRRVLNPHYREGMETSVKCGLRHAPAEAEAFMILLGDQPFLEGAVIDRLIGEHRTSRREITIPVYEGRRGHPVIFSACYREELLAIGDQGAREVVHRHAAAVREIAVGSDHILADLDTPEDYHRIKAQLDLEKRGSEREPWKTSTSW